MTITVFDKRDKDYFNWISRNPESLVMNTGRGRSAPYSKIHKATCVHISKYSGSFPEGGFTERQWIKICSFSFLDLEKWLKINRSNTKSLNLKCMVCNPDRTFLTQPFFVVGNKYSRKNIYEILKIPKINQGGNWDTGYHRYQEEWYIFCNIGSAGRTGHDYRNKFIGNEIKWYGRRGALLEHSTIQSLIDPETIVHFFYRGKNREPFFYQGLAQAKKTFPTKPPCIVWAFSSETEYHPERIPQEIQDNVSMIEGATSTIMVNSYERNPYARQLCLAHYGHTCQVCRMTFQNIYGEIGQNYIHVHHIRPLSEIAVEYEVDPIVDLIPVCPNCHAMLHQRKPPFSVEELTRIIEDI